MFCRTPRRPVEQWRLLRQKLHDEVCRNGFIRKLNSFVAYYGAKKVDASLLLPLVGFLPAPTSASWEPSMQRKHS
jgi:GH15 family glucan-1,4-alpha-glucosidase